MVLGDTTDDTRPLLRNYFAQMGLLLCNENPYLPSLPTVGGTWNDIVAMMETREVFYSKLYKGRVTYLSRALYYHLKPFGCGKPTSPPRPPISSSSSVRQALPAPRN